MILRLQSQEELELLQSRIKSRSKEVKVHMNGLREERGTLLKEEIQAKSREQTALAAQEGAGLLLKRKLLQVRSKKRSVRSK